MVLPEAAVEALPSSVTGASEITVWSEPAFATGRTLGVTVTVTVSVSAQSA